MARRFQQIRVVHSPLGICKGIGETSLGMDHLMRLRQIGRAISTGTKPVALFHEFEVASEHIVVFGRFFIIWSDGCYPDR